VKSARARGGSGVAVVWKRWAGHWEYEHRHRALGKTLCTVDKAELKTEYRRRAFGKTPCAVDNAELKTPP